MVLAQLRRPHSHHRLELPRRRPPLQLSRHRRLLRGLFRSVKILHFF